MVGRAKPKDVLEAAALDGAGWGKTFLFVTLPPLRRYMELAVLLGAIYVYEASTLLTSVGVATAGGCPSCAPCGRW